MADDLAGFGPIRSGAVGIGMGALLVVTVLFLDRSATFIYFRF